MCVLNRSKETKNKQKNEQLFPMSIGILLNFRRKVAHALLPIIRKQLWCFSSRKKSVTQHGCGGDVSKMWRLRSLPIHDALFIRHRKYFIVDTLLFTNNHQLYARPLVSTHTPFALENVCIWKFIHFSIQSLRFQLVFLDTSSLLKCNSCVIYNII